MDYYLLKQYDKMSDLIIPSISATKVKTIWENKEISDFVFTNQNSKATNYLPFYNKPTWLVSQDTQNILDKYQIEQEFKTCLLGQVGTLIQEIFFCMKPYFLDCLDITTEFYHTGTLKHIVLNKSKIKYNKVFAIANILENYLVVDYEILEKLLCAGVYPIIYEKLECV